MKASYDLTDAPLQIYQNQYTNQITSPVAQYASLHEGPQEFLGHGFSVHQWSYIHLLRACLLMKVGSPTLSALCHTSFFFLLYSTVPVDYIQLCFSLHPSDLFIHTSFQLNTTYFSDLLEVHMRIFGRQLPNL